MILTYEPCTIVGVNPINFEGFLILRILREVLTGDGFFYRLLVVRVDERNYGSFETGAAETSSINAYEVLETVVDFNEFRATALVVMNRTLAALFDELAEELHIAGLPCCDTFADTFVLRIEMLCASCKTCGHALFRLFVCLMRHIAQEGLVEGFDRLVFVCLHAPR